MLMTVPAVMPVMKARHQGAPCILLLLLLCPQALGWQVLAAKVAVHRCAQSTTWLAQKLSLSKYAHVSLPLPHALVAHVSLPLPHGKTCGMGRLTWACLPCGKGDQDMW